MTIIDLIRLHNSRNRRIRGEVREMRGLSPQVQIEKLGSLIHHLCVECAAEFVQAELGKGADSPFSRIEKGVFFHEMLLLNYWVAGHVIADKTSSVVSELMKQYLVSFRHLGQLKRAGDLSHVDERFRAYSEVWDDKGGHMDIFAEKAAEYLCGRLEPAELSRVSFWMIRHTDEFRSKMRDLKTICRIVGVRLKPQKSSASAAAVRPA